MLRGLLEEVDYMNLLFFSPFLGHFFPFPAVAKFLFFGNFFPNFGFPPASFPYQPA